MSTNETNLTFLSPVIRFSYPNLLVPVEPKIKGKKSEPKFGLKAIIPADSAAKFVMRGDSEDKKDTDLKKELVKLCASVWPNKKIPEIFPWSEVLQKYKGWPLDNGDKIAALLEGKGKSGEVVEALRGNSILSLSSNKDFAPNLFYYDSAAKKKIPLDRDDTEDVARIKRYFVGGNYGIVLFKVKPYDNIDERNFLTCYINSVMYLSEGTKFGTGSMMDRFEGVEGGEGDYDPSISDPDF